MNKIPEESCISSINAYFRSKDNISLYITRDRSHIPTEDNSGNFTIYIENINGCKCSTRNCMNNLADGKCTDRFVIEKIGKKFFADKYKDENTKQR